MTNKSQRSYKEAVYTDRTSRELPAHRDSSISSTSQLQLQNSSELKYKLTNKLYYDPKGYTQSHEGPRDLNA